MEDENIITEGIEQNPKIEISESELQSYLNDKFPQQDGKGIQSDFR